MCAPHRFAVEEFRHVLFLCHRLMPAPIVATITLRPRLKAGTDFPNAPLTALPRPCGFATCNALATDLPRRSQYRAAAN
jgi:hypothetical protein